MIMIANDELLRDIEQARRASMYLHDQHSQQILREYVAQLESLLFSGKPWFARAAWDRVH
jgi:hypothetical protein